MQSTSIFHLDPAIMCCALTERKAWMATFSNPELRGTGTPCGSGILRVVVSKNIYFIYAYYPARLSLPLMVLDIVKAATLNCNSPIILPGIKAENQM